MSDLAVAKLVDSSVLLDVVTDDPQWAAWSMSALARAFDAGTVHINPIIYAEASTRFDRVEDLDAAVPSDAFVRTPLPYAAGFLAA